MRSTDTHPLTLTQINLDRLAVRTYSQKYPIRTQAVDLTMSGSLYFITNRQTTALNPRV